MLLPSSFRLLLLFAIGGLLGCLTQARPLVPEIWRSLVKGFHAPTSLQSRHIATELNQRAVFDSPRPLLPKLDAPMKLKKRAPPPTRPGHDEFNMEFYVHKNISRVYEDSVQDVIRRATAIQKASKEPDKSKKPGVTVKTEKRWVHPGFEWTYIFRSAKGRVMIYNNATCADKVAIQKRIQTVIEFEKSHKEPGVSERGDLGRKEKLWFDQNFDWVKVVPTPKGAFLVPANITDTRREIIHQSVLVVMRFYGDRKNSRSWVDKDGSYGGLLERHWGGRCPRGNQRPMRGAKDE